MKKKLIEGQDYVIRVVPFPVCTIDGAVTSCEDGLFCIYINENVCPERRRKALKHELEHIINDDLYSTVPVEILERLRG